jgi:hypothetical protein
MVILLKELVLKMIQLYENWLFTYKLNSYMKISCSQVVKTIERVWKMGSVKIWQAASYLAALHATYRAGIWPFIEQFKSRHRLLEGPNRSARPTPQRIPSTL